MPFAPGLNVLTGETGAGKSIVIDALLLVRGARAQPDSIRTGAETAIGRGGVRRRPGGPGGRACSTRPGTAPGDGAARRQARARALRAAPRLRQRLARHGGAARAARRPPGGAPRPARAPAPAGAGAPARRCWTASRMRGARASAWARWCAGGRRRGPSSRALARRDARGRAPGGPLPLPALRDRRRRSSGTGEEDELRAERRRLQHAERIAAGLAGGDRRCSTRTPQSAASAARRARPRSCATLSRFDPDAAAPIEAIEGAQAYVEDAVGRARALRDRAVFDPERLEQIDERLDAIGKLKRKYGDTVAAIARLPARGRRRRSTGSSATTRSRRSMERAVAEAAAAAGAEAARALRGPRRAAARAARAAHPEGAPRARDGARALPRGPAPRAGGRGRARSGDGRLAGRAARGRDRRVAALGQPGRGPAAAGQGRLGRRALAHDAGGQDDPGRGRRRADAWSSTRWTRASAAAWPTSSARSSAPTRGRAARCSA